MDARELFNEVSAYCRAARMAETAFGRQAVNDGKFVERLRQGGRIRQTTIERVRAFMDRAVSSSCSDTIRPSTVTLKELEGVASEPRKRTFRFYDNRQKYLLFVNTCSEKRVVAERISMELGNIRPTPPSVRVFDAGVGDGTVLTRVMRALHRRFEMMPLYIVGKEISLEDVRLSLEKMPDRFREHPATVLILTNLNYSEAPHLMPSSVSSAASLIWHEKVLSGSTAAEYETQLSELEPFLTQHWRTKASERSGNLTYEKPVVLVVYLESCRFLLSSVLPKRGALRADYDLVIASQPYRARASTEFKASKVIRPLVQSLAPGGRLIGIHSCGNDPGMEIIRKVWPSEDPFVTSRFDLLKATRTALGKVARNFAFNAYTDERAVFRYSMYALPDEIDRSDPSIGTSTLFAAWNDAAYVAQIEDERLASAMASPAYLDATREVLKVHRGLWFNDESYVISRRRD